MARPREGFWSILSERKVLHPAALDLNRPQTPEKPCGPQPPPQDSPTSGINYKQPCCRLQVVAPHCSVGNASCGCWAFTRSKSLVCFRPVPLSACEVGAPAGWVPILGVHGAAACVLSRSRERRASCLDVVTRRTSGSSANRKSRSRGKPSAKSKPANPTKSCPRWACNDTGGTSGDRTQGSRGGKPPRRSHNWANGAVRMPNGRVRALVVGDEFCFFYSSIG